MIPGMQIFQACRRGVDVKVSHQQKMTWQLYYRGNSSKKWKSQTCFHHLRILAAWIFWLSLNTSLIGGFNLNISLCWLVWPSSVASGGRSDPWPWTDLWDNINISSTTEHFMPECFTSQSQMVWCQCSQCLKTVWVVDSAERIFTCRGDFKISKRMSWLPLYNMDAQWKTKKN